MKEQEQDGRIEWMRDERHDIIWARLNVIDRDNGIIR